MYTIHCPERDALGAYLEQQGIGTQNIYATPVPMQPSYNYLEYSPEDIPVSVELADQLLCLPVFPELTDQEIETISAEIHKFYAEEKR